MLLSVLKSKIHNAKITDLSDQYEGSFTIDRDLMDLVGFTAYEKILVSNLNNGNRFETYVSEGARQSRAFVLNGAIAKLGEVGDLVTVISFASLTPEENKTFQPKIATLDDNNNVVKIAGGEENA